MMYSLVVLSCVLWLADAYPTYYPYYGGDVDSLSYGSSDSSRGGMALSRYYNPYYNRPALGGGMAAFMFRPEETAPQAPSSQYYYADRRRQTPTELNYPPPQQNEVYFPQTSEKPIATEVPETAYPTDKIDLLIPTTPRGTVLPELTEPEIEEVEEPVQKPKKRVSKKKQVKKTVDDEEEDDFQPKMPAAAYFPMFFGWGGRSAGGSPGGATAIANAYSTGRGGVATSHATAYGVPTRQESKLQP